MSRTNQPSARSSPAAISSAVLMVAVVLVAALGRLFNPEPKELDYVLLPAGLALALLPVGALVAIGAPGNLVGRLLMGSGTLAAVSAMAMSLPEYPLSNWLCQWSWWPPLGALPLILLVFPDGHLPSARWRPLGALLVSSLTVSTLGIAVAATDVPDYLTAEDPAALAPWAKTTASVASVAAAITLVCLLGAIGALAARMRRAAGHERAIALCLLLAGVTLVLSLALEFREAELSWIPLVAAVPSAIVFAALRYHLYDIHLILNRAIVWTVMSLLLAAGIALVLTLLDRVAAGYSLLSYALITLLFEPTHRRVQHGVDRLLYGDRGDPYKIIEQLTSLFSTTPDPNDVLPRLVAVVATSLRLPYVAVAADTSEGPHVLAVHGVAPTRPESFDLLSRGTRVGQLLVAPRSRREALTLGERRILRDVAVYAAVASETAQLIRDLKLSKERLVTISEEERRKLRGDLHDGIGPALAGMSMQIRALSRVLSQPERASQILDHLSDDVQGCSVELRELVDRLRPAALDRGLPEALRAECRRFAEDELDIVLDVDPGVDSLPAAVETAAYRIVSEALANVSQHAHAHSCHVVVRRDDDDLALIVDDDGNGLPAIPRRSGIGLRSMRDRAAELGGWCVIGRGEPRGTRVEAWLPARRAV